MSVEIVEDDVKLAIWESGNEAVHELLPARANGEPDQAAQGPAGVCATAQRPIRCGSFSTPPRSG
jgi:hypothetical protein